MATAMTSAEFLDRLRVTTEFLEAIVADRGLLAEATPDDQRRLLQAAGQVYAPDANARRQLVRATVRRRKAERVRREDQALDQTGIRALRRRPVVITPNVFPPPDFEPARYRRRSGRQGGHSSRSTATCAKRSTRSCITSTISSARRAPPSISPSAPSSPTCRAGWRCSPAAGSRSAIRPVSSCCGPARTSSSPPAFPATRPRGTRAEPDFGDWGHRLEIFGLDLRHTPSVEAFCRRADRRTRDRLDFIINNACQTVRRPPAFYEHMMDGERAALRGMAARTRRARWAATRGGARRIRRRRARRPSTLLRSNDGFPASPGSRTRPSCPRSGFCRRSIRSRPTSSRKAASIRICSRSTCASTTRGAC